MQSFDGTQFFGQNSEWFWLHPPHEPSQWLRPQISHGTQKLGCSEKILVLYGFHAIFWGRNLPFVSVTYSILFPSTGPSHFGAWVSSRPPSFYLRADAALRNRVSGGCLTWIGDGISKYSPRETCAECIRFIHDLGHSLFRGLLRVKGMGFMIHVDRRRKNHWVCDQICLIPWDMVMGQNPGTWMIYKYSW
jgi:hypothetical protein